MTAASRIAELDRSLGATGEQVYRALREAIVAATLEPGARLSENEIAGAFGVSRTPVREAFARLREDRLVTVVPQLGTFVTRISVQAIADAAFVREALECAAVRLATQRATDAELAELRANLDRQLAAGAAADPQAFDELDEQLHRALCDLSGHGVAWFLSRRANGQLERVRRLSLPQPGYLSEMIAEHRTVVDAIAERDAEAAEAALRHHLSMVLSLLPVLESAHPDYFEPS